MFRLMCLKRYSVKISIIFHFNDELTETVLKFKCDGLFVEIYELKDLIVLYLCKRFNLKSFDFLKNVLYYLIKFNFYSK
jgi:predicted nucleotidyltransferase